MDEISESGNEPEIVDCENEYLLPVMTAEQLAAAFYVMFRPPTPDEQEVEER